MGLYDQTDAALTSGELPLLDYWRAHFDATMLETAVTTRQPEGRIGLELASAIRLLDSLLARYPRHERLLGWRTRATAIAKQVDPNAARSSAFTGACLWGEHSYREAWVNLECARVARAHAEHALARDCERTARQKLESLHRRVTAGESIEGWPAEALTWIRDRHAMLATAPSA